MTRLQCLPIALAITCVVFGTIYFLGCNEVCITKQGIKIYKIDENWKPHKKKK